MAFCATPSYKFTLHFYQTPKNPPKNKLFMHSLKHENLSRLSMFYEKCQKESFKTVKFKTLLELKSFSSYGITLSKKGTF